MEEGEDLVTILIQMMEILMEGIVISMTTLEAILLSTFIVTLIGYTINHFSKPIPDFNKKKKEEEKNIMTMRYGDNRINVTEDFLKRHIDSLEETIRKKQHIQQKQVIVNVNFSRVNWEIVNKGKFHSFWNSK